MHINFNLPLQDPVLVFVIILFIILFSPILLNRIKIPPIIGLLLAGIIIGPNGFNLLARNASIILFGTVGLLYIMFLAGLEIDLVEFKKNKNKSIVFGIYTFFVPMITGTVVFYFFLDYSLISSLLIASMFASHTLVTYPMVSKLGISKNQAVTTAVGGTMITDTAALLVLAVIAGSATGQVDSYFWIRLVVSVSIFAFVVLYFFPKLSRWFFKLNSDSITQFIFVLGIVFLSAFLAQLAGIEGIIGAFLAGLALNRLIPHTSPLMSRIEFVGNALFIPFFLIGVGMLIDYRVLFGGYQTLLIAFIMTFIAVGAKFLAAKLTQKTFKFSSDQGLIIFGLSNSQAAATLAAVLIGYNIILGTDDNGAPIRLLNDYILNGTIVMILVSCTISSFATQKAAIGIAKTELSLKPELDSTQIENTMIGLSNENTVRGLIQFTINTLDKNKITEFYGLHIITADKENTESVNKAKKLIEQTEKYMATVPYKFRPLLRYDFNITSGIMHSVKEKNIHHFYIGLHEKTSVLDSTFGNLTEELLQKNDSTIYIYKEMQPINTIQKYVMVIPVNAELEHGFCEWFLRISQIAVNTGIKFIIYSNEHTAQYIKKICKRCDTMLFKSFDNFDKFPMLVNDAGSDTLLIVNMARKESVSYHSSGDKVFYNLNKYFSKTGFLLVYANNYNKYNDNDNLYANPSLQDNIIAIKDTVGNIFKRSEN